MSAQDSDGDLSFSNKQEGRLSEDHVCPINAHSNAREKQTSASRYNPHGDVPL